MRQPRAASGASGVVMGALGLLTVPSLILPKQQKANAIRLIAGGLLAGVLIFVMIGVNPETDVVAHLGGFVTGWLLGLVLARVSRFTRRPQGQPRRRNPLRLAHHHPLVPRLECPLISAFCCACQTPNCSMCSSYSYIKDEAKLRLRDKILVYGAVPRTNIRPITSARSSFRSRAIILDQGTQIGTINI